MKRTCRRRPAIVERHLPKEVFRGLVRRTVSSVVFRNMSSEPVGQPAPPSEGDEQESMSITDPTVMRALAHPVRIALIELFGVHPTLTATQASEALGESPANCAFHLRTLAKYGFLEEAGGGRGRERPWKASEKAHRIRLPSSDLDSE